MRKSEREFLNFENFKSNNNIEDEKLAEKEFNKALKNFEIEKQKLKDIIIQELKDEKRYRETYSTLIDILAESLLFRSLLTKQMILDGFNFVEYSAAGTAKSNPLFSFLRDVDRDIRDILKELGMTPLSYKKIIEENNESVVNILNILDSLDETFGGD